MPALTKEELEARKRARNSRIMESRVDRMAVVQDTTADRVTMPEEYYRQPSKGSEHPGNGQQQESVARMLTGNAFIDSMLQNNTRFSELLNSLNPEMKRALESGDVGQLLSSMRALLPDGSSNPEVARKQRKAGLLAIYISVIFYLLSAFSSLVKLCVAHYATSEAARWITKHTVGPLFTFFHTVEEIDDFPQMKFKLGLLQLIILSLMAYYGLVYKAAGMGLVSFLRLLFKSVTGIILTHILVYTVLWCVIYICH